MDTATTRSGTIANQSERAPLIALDLARGLAAVMVMLVHVRARSFVELGALPLSQQSWPVAIFFAATRLGVEAVLVFFVLSGFLVGGRIIQRAKSSTFSLKDYGIDRCSRILLPLIPACLLTVLIGHFVLGQGINLPVLTANMLGLNGVLAPTLDANLPLWSLSYEIWFYIAGGACWVVTRRPLGAIVALAACSVVFSILAASLLLCWAFSALMVLTLDVPRKRLLFMVGLAVVAAGIAFLQLSVGSRFLAIAGISYVSPEVSRTLLCIGASLQLPYLCSAGVDHALHRLAAPARALAAFSYSLYLIHYPVNLALDHVFAKAPEITAQSLTILLARITICVAASLLFYFCFERHTLAVRCWLKRAMTQASYRSYPIPL
jgi:peptidoglycan/LPS O-acetylase OafA/YrhL